VLEVNKKIAEHMPENTRFAEEIVRNEGPAILAFFIQGAMEGWQTLQRTGSFIGETVKEVEEAAKSYRRAANPFLQWIREECEEDEARGTPDDKGYDYDAKAAFKSYMEEMREQNPRYHISKEDFRAGLERLGFPYDRRTRGKFGVGRYVFKGLRPKQEEIFEGAGELWPEVGDGVTG
jgi:phage/plasmid-associated DNA primase